MDLEIPGTDRRLDAVAVTTCIGERLGHGRLAGAEETELAERGRTRTTQDATHRLRLQCAPPQALQLGRRPGQHDDDGLAAVEDETRRRPGEPEREGAIGNRCLLAHAGLEVDVGPPQPLGEGPRDRADLVVQPVVEFQPHAGRAGDELDRAVVVRRPEPARDHAQVGV